MNSQAASVPGGRIVRHHPGAAKLAARSITRPQVMVINIGLLCGAAALLLSLVGVMAIATTRPDLAMRQAVFLAVGMLAAAIVAIPHYAWARKLSYPLLITTIGLLIFVMIPFVPEFLVRPKNGARRWINLGIMDFQPSEIAKIAFVLVLANYLRLHKNYRRLRGLIIPFVLTLVPMALILIEPDLGTSLLFVPTLFAMLIAAGAKLKHIALIVCIGLLCAPLMYPMLRPHQKDRILAMIGQLRDDPRYQDDIGFQAHQAATLVGAGGVAGVGAELAGHLIRFNSLPEEHNDMIFAVICLRWGMLGAVATVAAYLFFILGGLLTAAMCRDPFARLVAVGCVSVIAAQMTINIGMTIGLFPITGMTLPFVSYGGSSLLANWLMTGLLVGIAMRRPRFFEREPFAFDTEDESA
ncbi:MAG: FtsW/RodA/SpoVE family cell cycle protein [Phycisphaerales bacterium]